jgi:pyrimidine operon attenuation protein/uracil phosphoribosyltransferase
LNASSISIRILIQREIRSTIVRKNFIGRNISNFEANTVRLSSATLILLQY